MNAAHGQTFKYLLWLIAAAWMYTLAVIIDNYWSKYASYATVTHAYQQELRQKEQAFFQFLEKEQPLLVRLAEEKHDATDLKQIQGQPFVFFLYYTGQQQQPPFFWGTNQVMPPVAIKQTMRSGMMFKYGNGQYELLRQSINLNGASVEAIGLILLHRQYFIDNARLQKGFPGFKGLDGRMLFSEKPTPYVVNNAKGEKLFYLQPAVTNPFRFFSWLSFLVQLTATLMLIFLISNVAAHWLKQNKIAKGFTIFFAGFVAVWLCVSYVGFPINLGQFAWLEGGDNLALPPTALLHQLQNALFAFWVGLFFTTQSKAVAQLYGALHYKWRIAISIAMVLVAIALHFSIIENICTLYLSAAIAFDFNNFFSLNYTTIVAFVVIFLTMMAHFMLMRFFVKTLLSLTKGNMLFVLLALLTGGLLVLSVAGFMQYKIQLLFSLIWVLGFTIATARFKYPAIPVSSGRMVAWMLVYAFSISMLLGELSDERLRKRMYEIGKNLLMQNDQTSDYLVRFASGSIRRFDWKSMMQQAKDADAAQNIKDSITSMYFGGYLDRFVTQVYFYNQKGEGIHNNSPETYESLNTLFQAGRKEAGYPWLAAFEESFDKFGYIIKFEVKEGNESAANEGGHVFIVIRSVVMRNALLAPELFRQLQDFAVDLPPGFSYAWYKNDRLVEQYRNYPFPSIIPSGGTPQQSIWQREADGSFETWMNAGANTVLAISSPRKIWLDFVSLVAYLFCAFLLFYFLVRAVAALLQRIGITIPLFKPLTITIQAQIRLTIISILSISFLLVAVITIKFFIAQFTKGNEERLAKTVEAVSASLLQQFSNTENTSESWVPHSLNKSLAAIGRSLDTDINFYDRSGKLVASTQQVLFVKEVISGLMNPEAFFVLTKGSIHRHLMEETIGNLSYTSIYQPYRSADGTLIGYLQIPYFASQNELKQEISNFVVILINIIAFVFLISGGLAVLISGSITRSFSIIANKMNQLRLSEKNERIEWTANNEIGHLVKQYNRMIDELESSAKLLAQSEREMAWREMARQVAHEIKNPLTPMKLSLQFLQKAIHEKNPQVESITQRVAGNLVGQIDHLSKIAFEFSQFANIGQAKSQVFDLHEVLRELVMLYNTQERMHLHWQRVQGPLMVNADRTQMNRLFTNLIQNASESMEEEAEVKITVQELIKGQSLLIEITDNGPGIPTDVQTRIFMPNFTTKSSGTGLGLAISKAIVEKAGGKIWFKTSAEEGTTFFVSLPLVQ